MIEGHYDLNKDGERVFDKVTRRAFLSLFGVAGVCASTNLLRAVPLREEDGIERILKPASVDAYFLDDRDRTVLLGRVFFLKHFEPEKLFPLTGALLPKGMPNLQTKIGSFGMCCYLPDEFLKQANDFITDQMDRQTTGKGTLVLVTRKPGSPLTARRRYEDADLVTVVGNLRFRENGYTIFPHSPSGKLEDGTQMYSILEYYDQLEAHVAKSRNNQLEVISGDAVAFTI